MSAKAIAWVKKQTVGSPTSKAVLLLIAEHYSEVWGRSWPSRKLLAKESELSEKSVSRAIDDLWTHGWIHVEMWIYEDGRRLGNRYYLRRYRPEIEEAGPVTGEPLKVSADWNEQGKWQIDRASDWALLQV